MKPAAVSLPPDLRTEAEALLTDGETLSEFVANAVRNEARRRRSQASIVEQTATQSAPPPVARPRSTIEPGPLERKLVKAIARKPARSK
jgi:hypothetical protein